MIIIVCSKKILKFLSFPTILCLTFLEINILNREIKAENKLPAATEQDLFLYRQMGASYLCIASKAEVDFSKGLGIASATFAQVIIGKHGGLLAGFENEKFNEEKLFNAGTFQIVGSALQMCPNSIPNDVKKDYEKRLKEIVEKNKK